MNRHQKPGKIRVVADKRTQPVPRRRASDRVAQSSDLPVIARAEGQAANEKDGLLLPALLFLGSAALGGAGFVLVQGGWG